jgi:hypothetical protein
MYNWSVDITKFKTQEEYEIWRLESLINFGLNGEKIELGKLVKYWDQLTLDPKRKTFLEFLLKNLNVNV